MKLIDTNVILRFLVRDDSKMFERAKRLFELVDSGKEKVEIKTVVLFESIFVLQSYYELSRSKITDILSTLLGSKGVFIRKKRTILYALELYKNTKFHIVDCYLAAELTLGNVSEIYSFDRDFDKLGVRRLEP